MASYLYDADGDRYSAASGGTTTSYVVDTSLPYASVVEEYSSTANVPSARYDYGDDLVRMDRGGVYYYIYDGLGSTRQLVNTSGAVTDSYGYSAFGEIASRFSAGTATVNPFLFNAQQFDQGSGDYYLRARYYDQSNGRFISQDSFDGVDEDPVTLHRYLYVSDNPVSHSDPGGNADMVELCVASSITASLMGFVSVTLVGGTAGDRARATIYGAGAGLSLAVAFADGHIGQAIWGGVLGALGNFLLDLLVEVDKESSVDINFSPEFTGKLIADGIEGFALGAGNAALGIDRFWGGSKKELATGAGTLAAVGSLATTMFDLYIAHPKANPCPVILCGLVVAAIQDFIAYQAVMHPEHFSALQHAYKLIKVMKPEEISAAMVTFIAGFIPGSAASFSDEKLNKGSGSDSGSAGE